MMMRREAIQRLAPQPQVQPQEPPKRGMFLLSCNNRRRQIGGYQAVDCEGTLYSDGYVHLNTTALPIREYTTLFEMRDVLEACGDCVVTWLGGEEGAS